MDGWFMGAHGFTDECEFFLLFFFVDLRHFPSNCLPNLNNNFLIGKWFYVFISMESKSKSVGGNVEVDTE